MIEQYMVYRPPKRKKTKKIPLYIYTTSDKFSRIIAESDTQEELAKMIGLPIDTVQKGFKRLTHGNVTNSRYAIVYLTQKEMYGL